MRRTTRRHITSQTLREMADDAIYLTNRGDSENDIIITLFHCYQDHEVESYLSLRHAYFATYAAYSLGEAEEVAAFITNAFAEDGEGGHYNLINAYSSRIDRPVRDRIMNSFDRELRIYGRRIARRIAGDCSPALA